MKGVWTMKQFKYNLLQRVYLKETFNDVPIGSKVTVMGRYVKDNKSFYHIIQGDISFKSENEPLIRDVPEDFISSRPPYEKLYAIKTELYYKHKRKNSENNVYTIKYILGNIDTAKTEFYCEVDKYFNFNTDKLQCGKISLYVPVIRENGYVLDMEEENIDQKFFFEVG